MEKQTSHMQFQNSSNDYVDTLINNLNSGFDKDSMKALQLLNMVLNPSLVPKNSTIESYGCDAMKEIVGHYGVKMVLLIQNRRLSQSSYLVSVKDTM